MYLFIGGLGTSEVLVMSIFGCFPFLLVIFALVDILSSNFRDSNTKLIWVIVVVFVPVLGSILYFIMGRNQKIRETDKF
jgi:hypothetical protein